MNTNTSPVVSLSFGRRMALFVCLFFLCFVISGVIGYLVLRIGHDSQASMRIATVVQDVVVFIVPAVGLAMLITRRPDRFLGIDSSPVSVRGLVAVLTLIAAIPVMNAIVAWNESLHLPQSMAPVERWMMEAEERARALTDLLMGGSSVMDLVMGLLVVGVLAGLSEELFFRGALQRLLMTRPMNPHVAIWLTAFIFSVFHFQFFGFFPRMLLGAFLGYAAWWGGSLWVAVAVHALNNMIVVIVRWLEVSGYSTTDFNEIGTHADGAGIVMVAVSALLCAAGIWLLHRMWLSQTSCGGK